MVKITFPDNSVKELDNPTGLDIANSISEGLARASLAIEVDGKLIDLNIPIKKDAKIKIITFKDEEGVEIFRHSSAHLMAAAVKELFPYAKPTIGPAVKEGFYYDFDHEPFTPEDMNKIEKKMKELVDKKIPFEKKDISKKQALELFKDNEFKTEMINELEDGEISIYSLGDFIDLCRGPHVLNSKNIKSFKLTKVAGAYWRADAKNKQLQRIYGISFPDKKDLKAYLVLIEEAEKRDHRKIGRELDLFSFHEEAPGMPFFHDKGTFIWNTLHEFIKDMMIKRNYEINRTPLILNKSLWLQSGHWDHYKDNMYFTKIDQQDFAVKPMNCPGNIIIFKTQIHSYRDLPVRAGEFGLVHRHELSGVLSGLFRVRCFTQDDAHIFCTKDQIKDEVKDLINFIDEVYTLFGFEYYIELSTKPDKAMGDPKLWDLAENTLKEVLEESKKDFKINPGDGAFYGPKIDFHLKDAIGRTWQCGTIQLDFQMPEKFDLSYEGEDGKKHRPVMLHRVILGSVERFIGVLIEHFAGKLPIWISPVQTKIITVADRFESYAKKVKEELEKDNIRVEIDCRSETVNKKIREAQLQKIPYILVVGEKEESDNSINVRTRDNVVHGASSVEDFKKKILKEIHEKTL